MGGSLFLWAICSIVALATADQLLILRSPKAIEFKGESYLTTEALEDVIAASLGYSVPTNDELGYFDGLVINDPFNIATGFVGVAVEGAGPLDLQNSKSFEVVGEGDPLGATLHNLEAQKESVVELDLKTDVTSHLVTPFGTISPKENNSAVNYMKPKKNKADQDLLEQLAILDGLTSLLTDANSQLPTAALVRVSFNAFAKVHESDSTAYVEGVKLLKNSIEALAVAAEKAYKGKALVAVLNTAEAHARAKRQAVTPAESAKELNIVAGYDENYPVFFNIFFWFMFAFFFTLLAVSLAIGTMDPGRDSIIYRMTSTRMKKDN